MSRGLFMRYMSEREVPKTIYQIESRTSRIRGFNDEANPTQEKDVYLAKRKELDDKYKEIVNEQYRLELEYNRIFFPSTIEDSGMSKEKILSLAGRLRLYLMIHPIKEEEVYFGREGLAKEFGVTTQTINKWLDKGTKPKNYAAVNRKVNELLKTRLAGEKILDEIADIMHKEGLEF